MSRDFLSLYVSYAREFCHAPDHFHVFAGMNALSTAVGTNLGMQFGDRIMFPNLWILLLAESGDAKTAAMNIAANLLAQGGVGTILPDEFSAEALIDILKANGSGTLMIPEFSAFMGVLRKKYNEGLMGTITSLYDVPTKIVRATRGGGTVEMYRPCLSIFACSVPEYMRTNEDEWRSGFGPRFLLVYGEQTRLIPLPPPADKQKAEQLIRFLKNARTVRGNVKLFNPPLYETWARQNWEKSRGAETVERAFRKRLSGYVIKMAILMQLSKIAGLYEQDWYQVHGKNFYNKEEREQLDAQDFMIFDETMEAAIGIGDMLAGKLVETYEKTSIQTNDWRKTENKVVAAIRSAKDNAFRRTLLQNLHMEAKALDRVLDSLVQSGTIARIMLRKTPKASAEPFFYLAGAPPQRTAEKYGKKTEKEKEEEETDEVGNMA